MSHTRSNGFVGLVLAALVATPAFAGAPKVDVSNDSITCNTLIATAGVKPSLVNGGSSPTLVTLKGTLGGCTVSGANAATVVSGSFSGKLTGTSNDCASLAGTTALTGTLTFKWKGAATTPLLQTSSIVTVTTLTGGDGGATSSNFAATSQDVTDNILPACAGAGIKLFNLGLGTITLK